MNSLLKSISLQTQYTMHPVYYDYKSRIMDMVKSKHMMPKPCVNPFKIENYLLSNLLVMLTL